MPAGSWTECHFLNSLWTSCLVSLPFYCTTNFPPKTTFISKAFILFFENSNFSDNTFLMENQTCQIKTITQHSIGSKPGFLSDILSERKHEYQKLLTPSYFILSWVILYFYSVSGQKWPILRHSADICLIQALKISNLFEQVWNKTTFWKKGAWFISSVIKRQIRKYFTFEM